MSTLGKSFLGLHGNNHHHETNHKMIYSPLNGNNHNNVGTRMYLYLTKCHWPRIYHRSVICLPLEPPSHPIIWTIQMVPNKSTNNKWRVHVRKLQFPTCILKYNLHQLPNPLTFNHPWGDSWMHLHYLATIMYEDFIAMCYYLRFKKAF